MNSDSNKLNWIANWTGSASEKKKRILNTKKAGSEQIKKSEKFTLQMGNCCENHKKPMKCRTIKSAQIFQLFRQIFVFRTAITNAINLRKQEKVVRRVGSVIWMTI